MYETLKGVFSAESVGEAANLLNRSSVKYDEILLSMSDNLPLRYLDSLELANAYDLVSRADIFRGRVGTENWRLLRYFFNLLAEASTVSPKSFKPFEFIYPPIRVSRRTAKKDIVPFLKIILKKQKSSPIISWLKLESDEVDYLAKMNKF